jgi:hypothetical protein
MDMMTLLFIGLGIILLMMPLKWVNGIIGDNGSQPSYPVLIVPILGAVLLAIGLLAYHKSDIQCIFYKACRDIDQSGLGMGVGQAGISLYNSLFGLQPTESQVSNLKPLSQIQ